MAGPGGLWGKLVLLGAVGGDFVLGVVLNQGHPSESPGGIVKKREVQALQGGPPLPQEILMPRESWGAGPASVTLVKDIGSAA